MSKDKANELKVGIVVLICLALGFIVVLQLSNWRQWFEPKLTLTFKIPYQAELGGIKSGWPVTIGGVSVGNVQQTWVQRELRDPREKPPETKPAVQKESEDGESTGVVSEDQPPEALTVAAPEQAPQPQTNIYAYFRFTVPSKYQLRQDCELTPAAQLIGGEGELKITKIGTGKVLQDGQEVFRDSLGGSVMASIMASAQATIDDAKEMTEGLKPVVERANAAMANVEEITEKFKPLTETAHTAMANVRQITEDFKEISSQARTTFSLSKPQLESIVANIRAASVEMKEGMREIRWNPWRLLHDPSDRELRTQNLLTAARAFSSGASDLDAAASRLQALADTGQGTVKSDDPELAEIIEQLKAAVAKFTQAEQTFFERLGKGK